MRGGICVFRRPFGFAGRIPESDSRLQNGNRPSESSLKIIGRLRPLSRLRGRARVGAVAAAEISDGYGGCQKRFCETPPQPSPARAQGRELNIKAA